MRARMSVVAVAIIIASAFALKPVPAAAGLHLCNQTSETIHAVIGYSADNDITTRGWWNIDPASCATPIGYDLGTWTNYYVYAYSSSETWADNSSDGNHWLCLDPTNAFTLYNARTSCDYEHRYFRYIDTENSNSNDCDFVCPNYSDFTYNLTP